ncbi:A/G-specific adenine glycosylase [Aureibacillus halotolerans]|uniref:Adenine DNA glycosylase n=1 Tax=Aureibacillus halotolerans TaxID=1508390 RepID=A0A4R6TPG5_9BACI|nr:A/G-specific adenine glycosylase [Aureibacillus halotolerans]TDQ33748.1 A/G-specific DNA-adenine glycosylase [Aureibacillus halotolerans]
MAQEHYANALTSFDHVSFQEDLITWFLAEQRDLPWRKDQTPYKVWLSEIMLQQTRVDTVIPYFNRFVSSFPTLEALAQADEQDVLKHWEGLGYYSRARNFQSAVREIVSTYGGNVPADKKSFQALKGVGPYTAGAVLSIAFNKAEPAVDGNVLRVFSRLFAIADDIAEEKTRKAFEAVVATVMDKERPSEFNQGVMELGAIVCTPKKPTCLICPVRAHCQAYATGQEDVLPVKKKKKKAKEKHMTALVITDENGDWLIHKRPSQGLLANLWEFPNCETVNRAQLQKDQAMHWVEEEYHIHVEVNEHLLSVKHAFSHLVWNIDVFHASLQTPFEGREGLQFVSEEEILQYPFSVSHQKILHHIIEGERA